MHRRWLRACLLSFLAVTTSSVLAQSDEVPSTHVVEPGDTLWDLSDRYYGNPLEAWRLWMQTPDIEDPDRIFPGQVIQVRPDESESVRPDGPGIAPVPRLRPPRPAIEPVDDAADRLWRGHVDVTGKPGTDRSLGGASLVMPLWQTQRQLLFLDIRGLADDRDALEGNLGLAYRTMHASGWNLGGYGFLDVRRSRYENTFYQATLGAEALSTDWDLRANVYIPVGNDDKRVARGEDVTFSGFRNQAPELTGGTLAIRTTVDAIGNEVELRERALAGIDAEVGYRLPVFPAEGAHDLRMFVGGYHFDASGVESVTGPRGRLEYRLYDPPVLPTGSRLTAGVEIQRDDPRGTQGFGVLTLRIPLGSGARRLEARERRMVDPIVRDVDIVSGISRVKGSAINEEREYLQPALNDATGQSITEVVQLDTSENPAAALSGAGPGTLVVLDDVGAPLQMGGEILFVESGQTLVGGGHALTLRGADDGQTLTYNAPGSVPTIESTALEAISVGGGSYVGGLTVSGGAATTAIGSSSGRGNIHIVDNDIAAAGINGIGIGANNSNVVIRGNTINLDDSAAGIEIGAGGSGMEVADNTLTGSAPVQGDGISLRQGVTDAVIRDNVIQGGEDGVVVASQGAQGIALENNTIEDVGQHGLNVTGTAGDSILSVNGNRFQGTAGSHLIRIAPGDYSGAGNTSDVVLGAGDELCSRSGLTLEYTGPGFQLTPDGGGSIQCGDDTP